MKIWDSVYILADTVVNVHQTQTDLLILLNWSNTILFSVYKSIKGDWFIKEVF